VYYERELVQLPERWRAEAAILRRRGAAAQAELLESCATDLEQDERERGLQALTLEDAAAQSGYSYSALQKMVADGQLLNVGKKGKPLVRRGDIPRKPRRREAPDLAGAVIAGRIGEKLDNRRSMSQNA
jgi:hypothetical protein